MKEKFFNNGLSQEKRSRSPFISTKKRSPSPKRKAIVFHEMKEKFFNNGLCQEKRSRFIQNNQTILCERYIFDQ
ncbi:hypothetical protein QUA40_00025 [Microcoleus sp. Pol11C3]|uniref:hypothetical protein n=1 Tax=Microcoleus sp. Pol11C3 TaxID=3055390 RepID=UPI002FD6BF8F